jgi:UDPglucose--hexose-1-phosphate uridylyltransferase
LTGDCVVVATERAKRPHSYARETKVNKEHTVIDCPFCAGNEGLTPPEIFAVRSGASGPDSPGWRVRVVPNKFPAFVPDAATPGQADPLHSILGGTGRHEVIIHSPDHWKSLGRLSPEEIARIFAVYQARLRSVSNQEDIAAALIIINHGVEAGASIRHPHSQLFAIPIVPPLIEKELLRFSEHLDDLGSCLLCDLIDMEKSAGVRMVAENDEFVAFCPFASRVPFETYIVPKKHAADFASADEGVLRAAAELMGLVLGRMLGRLGDVPYNIYLHTRPFRSDAPYHWHFAVLPKTTIIAGFEYGSGMMINVVEPETAAEFLSHSGDRSV